MIQIIHVIALNFITGGMSHTESKHQFFHSSIVMMLFFYFRAKYLVLAYRLLKT